MRGADIVQESLFSTVHLETFVPEDHPLRGIKSIFDESLRRVDLELSVAYSDFGRESIAPEKLLRALLLQVLFTVRSERQLVENTSGQQTITVFTKRGMVPYRVFYTQANEPAEQ